MPEPQKRWIKDCVLNHYAKFPPSAPVELEEMEKVAKLCFNQLQEIRYPWWAPILYSAILITVFFATLYWIDEEGRARGTWGDMPSSLETILQDPSTPTMGEFSSFNLRLLMGILVFVMLAVGLVRILSAERRRRKES